MVEIKATNDGSFDFAIPSWDLGYYSDSGGNGGSCFYLNNNSIYIGWDAGNKQIYFRLQLNIGRLKIKVDT